MFSRLGLKLFGAILLVNVLLGALIFFAAARSIDDDFLGYLRRTQEARIDTLSETLVEGYARHGSWDWISEDRTAWHDVLRLALMPRLQAPPPERPAPEHYKSGSGRPPSDLPPPLTDPRQFVLLDARQNLIIGASPRADDQMLYRTLELDGVNIGQLGYRAPDGVITSLDQVFLHRQLRNLGIITGVMLLTSLLLAFVLAWWLGRRTRAMALATRAIAGGDYNIRLRARGRDELSRLSADINALAYNLEQNRISRQQWVADISHELRTPLAILRGEIEAMQDGMRPLDERSLGSLSQEVEHLNRLIEDLRLLAQSDAHTLDAPLEPLNLSEHLSRQLEESREWLTEKGIALSVHIAPDLLIMGAPHRLRQLWRNLLSNTRAYTDAPGTLRVSLERQGQQAIIVWEDSAPGVPEADQPRLTERLFRLDASRNRRRGGSGLGLSIATALLQAHQASMTPATSALGGLRWRIAFNIPEGISAHDANAYRHQENTA